ncbi:galactan 5-O-arabinofuranosyltransferase [Tsukamurella soli]|uniref:Galactan 5-O-arabinofuranosyltransferase n=1 Tax=Tsukamurella soli TaxID=644556 RepID=A0ABP8JQK0_9ACTN
MATDRSEAVTATAPVPPASPDAAAPHRAVTVVVDLACAVVLGGIVAAVGYAAIGTVHWPAYPSSDVTRTLTTLGQVACIAILAVCAWLLSTEPFGRAVRPALARTARVLAFAATSALVTVTLALPLGATKLYLGGITVDQQFRTEYLTRFTQSPALHDMTYFGMPPFYSPGWFWLGGRFAHIAGLAGWAAFKPWSVISLAVAATVALALWLRVCTPTRAIAATLATTVAMLLYGSAEPYGAVITLLLPPMSILAWRALTGTAGRAAVVGVGVYLGVAVWFYTLYLALAAFTVCVMAVVALGAAWWRRRVGDSVPFLPIIGRLVGMGVIAIVIGLGAYGPYFVKALSGSPTGKGTAFHYLPVEGTVVPFPMLHASLPGLLALIGVVWAILRCRTNSLAQAMGLAIAAAYGWALLSMAATLAGTTLLGFRTESMLHVLLAAAGALGVVDLVATACAAAGTGARVAAVVLATVAAIGVAQTVPQQLSGVISTAYTDTDGDGVRADARPPGAEQYFPAVDAIIRRETHRPRTGTVVLTAEYGFLAVYPYWGFQNLTSNYANPLAQFAARSAAIKQWAASTSPDDLIHRLNTSKWRPPTAFVFRSASDGYELRLAEDVYPNNPNVKRYTVAYPPALFDDPRFDVSTVGPFVVVVRKP